MLLIRMIDFGGVAGAGGGGGWSAGLPASGAGAAGIFGAAATIAPLVCSAGYAFPAA
jgi:hypothetical protein